MSNPSEQCIGQCPEHEGRAYASGNASGIRVEHVHGRTDGRTDEEQLLPTRDTSSSVTRTRAYDDDEVAEYHARVQALRKEPR